MNENVFFEVSTPIITREGGSHEHKADERILYPT